MRITLFHPTKRRPSAPTSDLLAMQARKESRLAHYERFFGPSFAISAQVEGAPYVDLLVFAPNPLKGRDHYTLATDGLSDLSRFSANGHGTLPALEVIAYTRDLEAGAPVVRLIQRLAGALADPGKAIRPWSPVAAKELDPEFPAKAKAHHLVLLPPVREWKGFGSRRFSDDTEVRFQWAALLAPADVQALKADRDGFLARLASGPVPLLSPV